MEYDDPASDIQVETAICHDCEYWKEMIERVQQRRTKLRSKYAGVMMPFPSERVVPAPDVDYLSQEARDDMEQEEKLEARLKSFVLSQLAHQRSAHRQEF
jgi:hypothetical protein